MKMKVLLTLCVSAFWCFCVACSQENDDPGQQGNNDKEEKPEEPDQPGDSDAPIAPWDKTVQYPAWGVADTLARYSIGPGIIYTEINFKTAPLRVFVTEIDLNNELNNIEQYQYDVPNYSGDAVSTQCKENWSINNARVVSGVNNDFFVYSSGITLGANIRGGEVVYGQSLCVSALAINDKKEASTFTGKLNSYVTLPNNVNIAIDQTNVEYNANKLLPAGLNCVLFNRFYDYTNYENTTNLNGTFVEFLPQGEWYVNGDATPCKVLQISDQKIPLVGSTATNDLYKRKNYVLYLQGAKQTTFKSANVKVGDIIKINKQYNSVSWGTAIKNIKTTLHGYPAILINGKINTAQLGLVDHLVNREPRTMCGLSKDKRTVYMVVVDGRKAGISRGGTCEEIAKYMQTFGANDVLNFDGGGSSAMVIREGLDQTSFVVKNTPSDGSERKIKNSMHAVSLAPKDEQVDSYAYMDPVIEVEAKKQITLPAIYSFNKYGELVSKEVGTSGVSYKCVPETLGTVNNGVLTAGDAQYGYIVATKDGKSFKVRVKVE